MKRALLAVVSSSLVSALAGTWQCWTVQTVVPLPGPNNPPYEAQSMAPAYGVWWSFSSGAACPVGKVYLSGGATANQAITWEFQLWDVVSNAPSGSPVNASLSAVGTCMTSIGTIPSSPQPSFSNPASVTVGQQIQMQIPTITSYPPVTISLGGVTFYIGWNPKTDVSTVAYTFQTPFCQCVPSSCGQQGCPACSCADPPANQPAFLGGGGGSCCPGPEPNCAPGHPWLDPVTCTWVCEPSPIIRRGAEWLFTYQPGVPAALLGLSCQGKVPWPDPRSGDRWLVDLTQITLPAPANLITNLFGDLSVGSDYQYSCGTWVAPGGPNGYRAVVSRFGVTSDCRVARTAGLALWLDANSNGIIEPDEVTQLTEAISVVYADIEPPPHDRSGAVIFHRCSADGKWCDVNLRVKQ